MQPFLGRDWQMRHGSRQDSGSLHSPDTLRSSSGVPEAGSAAGAVGRSSCESREEEEKICEHEDEGCEDEHSSWEESAAERAESGEGGVLVLFPSGTSTPSFSTSEPFRNTMGDESR